MESMNLIRCLRSAFDKVCWNGNFIRNEIIGGDRADMKVRVGSADEGETDLNGGEPLSFVQIKSQINGSCEEHQNDEGDAIIQPINCKHIIGAFGRVGKHLIVAKCFLDVALSGS
jgi:hypothetical protein